MIQETAAEYSGNEEPIGKIATFPLSDILVSGIRENVPKNSHLEFGFPAPLALKGIQNQPN